MTLQMYKLLWWLTIMICGRSHNEWGVLTLNSNNDRIDRVEWTIGTDYKAIDLTGEGYVSSQKIQLQAGSTETRTERMVYAVAEESNDDGINHLALEAIMLRMYQIVDPNVVRAQELGHKDNQHRFILIMPGTPYTLTLNLLWNKDDTSKGVVSWDIIMRQEPIDPRLDKLYSEHAKDVASFNKANAEVIKNAKNMQLLADTNVLEANAEYPAWDAESFSYSLSKAEHNNCKKVLMLKEHIPALWALLTERKLYINYIDAKKNGFQYLGRSEISYSEGSQTQSVSDAVELYLSRYKFGSHYGFIEARFMWKVWFSDGWLGHGWYPEHEEHDVRRRRMAKEFDVQSLSFEPYNYAAIMIGCFTIFAVITGMYLVLP